ncbi:hypothetical protein [Mesorhizobium sp. KR9-304]|uniref:hypothetical protein n=1 Tax=Mesorhizobium sp. KR9-304 TaxID=3156614 RepID=UPI0032B57603
MFLAFRLFGNFHWPPVPNRPLENPSDKDKQAGLIEIFFHKESDGTHTGLLKWRPGRIEPDNSIPDPARDTKLLFALTQGEALTWFKDQRKTGGVIWLAGKRADPDYPKILFRGAFLLQQIVQEQASSQQPVSDKVTLTWPLVEQVKYHADSMTHSSLALYHYVDNLFRFNLNLPLPVIRSLKDDKSLDVPGFSFGVVYNTVSKRGADPLVPHTLVGGWVEGDASKELEDPQSYLVNAFDAVADRHLGKFGFATKPDRMGYFVNLDGKGEGRKNHIPIELLWPATLKVPVRRILENYGFALGRDDDDGKHEDEVAKVLAPTSLSLRFDDNRLIYRIAIKTAYPDAASDVTIVKKAFQIRLAQELGGPVVNSVQYKSPGPVVSLLALGKTLFVDCELAWDIKPGNIWPPEMPRDASDDGRDWGGKVKLRLLWKEAVNDLTGVAANPKEPVRAGLLPLANSSLAATRDAMIAGEAGLPHSFLPDILNATAADKREMTFCLYGAPVDALFNPVGLVAWGKSTDSVGWSRPPMRLTLAGETTLIPGFEGTTTLSVELHDISFFQTGSVGLAAKLSHDDTWPPSSATDIRAGDGYFASYNLTLIEIFGPRGADEWSGRLSALRFKGSKGRVQVPDELRKNQDQHLRIGREGEVSAAGLPALIYPRGNAAVEFRIWIPAEQVDQITVDISRFDRTARPGPLLVPVGKSSPARGSPGVSSYWLRVTERLTPRDDRRLEADVFDLTKATANGEPRSFVVLSQEPFSVLKFTHSPLGSRGDAASASVAAYSGDTRLWQYKVVTPYYHYVLPPQAIGESADKPRRLEIHDLEPGSNANTPLPYVPDPAESMDRPPLRHRAVQFRLTPSAEFWIRPSDVERGYFVPESTSYEIFRQRGEYGLGAQLSYLRAEFLYGLPVGIDVSKETGVSRGARIAEIEALTGRLPGRGGDTAPTDQRSRWSAVLSAVARRPERLEVWARDLDSAVDFTPARFSDGVSFSLRGTALHRHPLGPDASVKSTPMVGNETPKDEKQEIADKPRHHPHGLSGGAIWPVESNNLFKALVEFPASKGGVIERIAFSPIGGDATQKAEFLDGKVTIISETYNGQVQRQQVEVLGRICASWHRAKHVVVYERTVNASAQFAPLKEQDPHRTRTRRPVLRKVREYIELIQPERRYPDFANADQRTSAFFERVRFNSRIINVDSAWSTDVGDFGWKIPLWNRLSARQRPQVYAMPDIVALTTGEDDEEPARHECTDPDYCFFFADFRATTSDTDLWQSRLGLDFANMPASKLISEKSDSASQKLTGPTDEYVEGRRRSVGRILPGLRQFTWRLAPAARKTMINAGRAGKPVFVDLESVTFMRASHAAGYGLHDELGMALDASAKLKRDAAADNVAKIAYWKTEDPDFTFVGKDKFDDIAGQGQNRPLAKAIRDKNPEQVRKLLADLRLPAGWETLKKELKGHLVGLVNPGDLDKFRDFKATLKSGGAFCDKLKQDTIGMVQRKEMLLRTAIHDLVGDGAALLDKLPVTKDMLRDTLTKTALKQLQPIFADASSDIGNLDEGVEKARSILVDLETEVDAVFERAHRRIEQFVAGYDHAKPWSEDRRKAFRNGLIATLSSVADDIGAAIDECRQRLGVELNNVSQAVGGHIARILSEVAQASLSANALTAHVADGVSKAVKKIDAALRDLDTQIGTPPRSKIEELIAKAKTIKSQALQDKVVKAAEKIRDLREAALKKIGEAQVLANAVDTATDQSLGNISLAMDRMLAALSEIGKILQEHVDAIAGALNDIAAELGSEIAGDFNTLLVERIGGELLRIASFIDGPVKNIDSEIYAVVIPATTAVDQLRADLQVEIRAIPAAAVPIIDDVRAALASAQHALSPDALVDTLLANSVVAPAVDLLLRPLPDEIDLQDRELVRARLLQFEEVIGEVVRDLSAAALGTMAELSAACAAIYEGVDEAARRLGAMGNELQAFVEEELDKAYNNFIAALGPIPDTIKDAEKLLGALKSFDYSVRRLQNDLSRSFETAGTYADRLFDLAGKLDDGGLMAAPSNILKLYSAVTSAPEIAALKADIDRIRSGFDELSDIIETTKANALFNRLGDELKGLGLSLPFDKIGDRLLPADLGSLDIGKVFRNFGGAKLDRLFRGYKIPAGVRDAVKITHDFDKKQARAWVQVDINAPMPGRRSLFSVGVFKADFVDMQLVGQVRLEASKDQDKVTQTGFGRIQTTIDMVAGGQSMVSFNKFGLNFTKEKGLDVEFDPKNIRLNPQFKFIQDFLSTLFGGDPGGLNTITENGMPVGVEHQFAIPPISLNFGTSGVQNVSIENRFKLVAYPDFMLADRFNLSTIDRPFIFAIFIIGGTGYIQLEAQYRPFDNELMVLVEAGAGGSASLAFAFGPFSGQVFITLSGTLSYRKLIGKPGGGLAISVVLVIAGHVNVAGIVTVGITLMLRMTYRDSGQIDGDGTLTVTIRISRFFKITARANVKYKLRGGKSETQISTSVKPEKLRQAAKKLEQARS